jgi:hypothetical protein
MNQQTLQKAISLDSEIKQLKNLNAIFSKKIRFSIDAMELNNSGSLNPYIIDGMEVKNLYQPELTEIIKNWTIEKLKQKEKELESL